MNANKQPSEVAMRVAKALQREFGGASEWTNTLLHMVAAIIDRELAAPEQIEAELSCAYACLSPGLLNIEAAQTSLLVLAEVQRKD